MSILLNDYNHISKNILIEEINNKQRDLKLETTGESFNFINLISEDLNYESQIIM